MNSGKTIFAQLMDFIPAYEFRKRNGAVKLHTLLDLHGNIPSVVIITTGKVHDVNILDQLIIELGAMVKKPLNPDQSRYTVLQILSLTLFEKEPIYQALSTESHAAYQPDRFIENLYRTPRGIPRGVSLECL